MGIKTLIVASGLTLFQLVNTGCSSTWEAEKIETEPHTFDRKYIPNMIRMNGFRDKNLVKKYTAESYESMDEFHSQINTYLNEKVKADKIYREDFLDEKTRKENIYWNSITKRFENKKNN